MSEAVTIVAVSEEVLDEEYDPHGNNKKKQVGTNASNSKQAFSRRIKASRMLMGTKGREMIN